MAKISIGVGFTLTGVARDSREARITRAREAIHPVLTSPVVAGAGGTVVDVCTQSPQACPTDASLRLQVCLYLDPILRRVSRCYFDLDLTNKDM